MNASFDAAQDRLLLRVSTTEGTEFRFWLTRRMVVRIWPRLMQVMDAAPAAPPGPMRSAPLEFRHAAAVEQADFATPYAVSGQPALSATEVLLVSRFSLTVTAPDHYSMMFAGQDGASVTLGFAAGLLHGFVKLVQDTAAVADWGVSLALPSAEMASMAIN